MLMDLGLANEKPKYVCLLCDFDLRPCSAGFFCLRSPQFRLICHDCLLSETKSTQDGRFFVDHTFSYPFKVRYACALFLCVFVCAQGVCSFA